jgi:hypothetical protein
MSTTVNLKSIDLISNVLFGEINLDNDGEPKRKVSTDGTNIQYFTNMIFRSVVITINFVTYNVSPIVKLPDYVTFNQGLTNVGGNLIRAYTNTSPASNHPIIKNQSISKETADIFIYDLSTRLLKKINTEAPTSVNDDTMEVSNPIEEDISMYDKLVRHRSFVERQGMIVGVTLSTVTLASSFLFNFIPWSASVPAALMFGSLSVFMFLRKKLRGDHND